MRCPIGERGGLRARVHETIEGAMASIDITQISASPLPISPLRLLYIITMWEGKRKKE